MPRSGSTRCSSCSGGGDDHPIVATFPGLAAVPEGWTVIGSVSAGEGVTVDGASYDGPRGHAHF